jgi:thiosulfate/3-mercaptopyruvate sulfurtransferase
VVIGPVVDLAWVRAHRDRVVLADVRHYLDGRSGRDAYRAGHLPGAVFVDVDHDLAADDRPPAAGRHPLPDPHTFAARMAAAGIGDQDTVIAYDDAGGVMAARLVWMLRATGHEAALLDGGIGVYDGDLEAEPPHRAPATFMPRPWPADRLASIDDAAAGVSGAAGESKAAGGGGAEESKAADRGATGESKAASGGTGDGEAAHGDAAASTATGTNAVVLDARPRDRFRGENETLDPRPGHIPGARSLPCRENLTADGRFLPVPELRERFAAVGVSAGVPVVSYCGSGVTACHNLLAMEHAGLGVGRLYPGSWSEYAHTDRPAATGD